MKSDGSRGTVSGEDGGERSMTDEDKASETVSDKAKQHSSRSSSESDPSIQNWLLALY